MTEISMHDPVQAARRGLGTSLEAGAPSAHVGSAQQSKRTKAECPANTESTEKTAL